MSLPDGRVEVVVQLGADLDGAGVQPGLVREGRVADVGLVVVGGDVGQLGDRVAHPLQLRQALRHHRQVHLHGEVGDQRERVGVARALAVAVRRPHVGDPGLDRGEEFATAQPVSSWQWMPSLPSTRARTSATTRPTSIGSIPPLVSHMTPTSAPAPKAASSTRTP